MAENPDLVKFRYSGPPVLIVATGEQVEDGDEIEGPSALASSFGFELVSGKSAPKKEKGEGD
jgi:hypothetical protein